MLAVTRTIAGLTFGLALACGKADRDPGAPNGGGGDADGFGGSAAPGLSGRSGGTGTSGGAPASGGAGSGGTTQTLPPPGPTDQVDLLLMVDNSISMADKQQLLRESVPHLVRRLVQPQCLDEEGAPTGSSVDASGRCAAGAAEFEPLRDIHIGVITSSLGAHGGQVCTEPDDDDKARLVTTMRPNGPAVATWESLGFLAWDPDPDDPRNVPRGESDLATLITSFQDMVGLTGEVGCGYEGSFEAWYRFLVDPDPPSHIEVITDPSSGTPRSTGAVIDPPDEALLAQRAAFLRPNSVLAIVMLSDENDCSIQDEGQGWIVGWQSFGGAPFRLPRATSACARNPNSECCTSCSAAPGSVPSSCGNPANDPECLKNKYTSAEDNANLRCFDQRKRFGFDLLYPIQRYVDGLTAPTVVSRRVGPDGNPLVVPNPLFAGTPARHPSRVFLAGIVGVPWQDIADLPSLAGPGLRFLNYTELVAEDRWSLILGSRGDRTSLPTPPRDALMIESDVDRSSLNAPPHPLLNVPLAPPGAPRSANPINGHETVVEDNSDLQYACTFPLPAPRNCGDDSVGCDCKPSDARYQRPICDGTLQTHAKAYPGVRHLELLKAVGQRTGNAVVGSICPKTTERSSSIYGYVPAMDALVERMKEQFRSAR